LRQIIPLEKTLVVLDTGPARLLGELDAEPPWLAVFVEMSLNGYCFSLAEIAAAELLAQYDRGALSPHKHGRMVSRLKRFISPEMPALASKKDIYGMLGLPVEDWSAREAWTLAQLMWAWLNDPSLDGRPGKDLLVALLNEERQDWTDHLRKARELAIQKVGESGLADLAAATPAVLTAMDAALSRGGGSPPLSLRCHLHSRYRWRQFVRTQQRKDPYDPESASKRNDGIDVDLYIYLMLPAFVVTVDNSFLGGLWDIESFQKDWFVTPDAFAAQWVDGKRPLLAWPHELGEKSPT
jgi:hypothetical protein